MFGNYSGVNDMVACGVVELHGRHHAVMFFSENFKLIVGSYNRQATALARAQTCCDVFYTGGYQRFAAYVQNNPVDNDIELFTEPRRYSVMYNQA